MMINKTTADKNTRAGICYGLAAYLWWSGAIFWFKAVAHVPASGVVAHRVIWSSVLLIVLLAVTGRLSKAVQTLGNRRTIITLVASSCLIATSWYVFVWAVAHDRVLETSLAYYIAPLINVMLGRIFLRERLSATQIVSVLLALLGIIILGASYGQIPFVSLIMATAFGFYGLLRKKVPVDATTGLAIETMILTPAALTFILYLQHQGQLLFGHLPPQTDLLLVTAGAVTVLPLVWYCSALRKLRYTTMGFMMYIMPSITFLIAVFVFGEPFGTTQLVTFCCIWAALLLYTYDSIRRDRMRNITSAVSDRNTCGAVLPRIATRVSRHR
jgi:chloramphenicol-sensitive protein RarD